MTKRSVLLEIAKPMSAGFENFSAAADSVVEADKQYDSVLADLGNFGLEPEDNSVPVPMLSAAGLNPGQLRTLESFRSSDTNADMPAETVVIACTVPSGRLDSLIDSKKAKVWQNSTLTLYNAPCNCGSKVPDALPVMDAQTGGGIDCRPFKPGVPVDTIRMALGTPRVWRDGYKGQNIIVGIIDEGVNGIHYPVVGGFSRPNAGLQPGQAGITSHGSMCAADVLVAAPASKIYDYPFLGIPNSGGALQMFHAVLDQRRRDGTPHITNNSYGFVGVPPRSQFPGHEIWELNHPLHRKIREVVAAGVACFFAAGNCGANCPSGACHPTGIGSGKSIHASNSLLEVITVAAVNSGNERIGYSSQGPGMFEVKKPDISAYSHLYGNFGPGRPGGLDQPFDNGTSAATPVAAGVGALLLSAFANLTPQQMKQVLIDTATELGPPGWDNDHGQGVINAAAAYMKLMKDFSGSGKLIG